MQQISICIPTWNRVEMTLNSFKKVYDDARIDTIVILDDASDIDVYNRLKEECDKLSKVKLYRNVTNQDCYANKFVAVSYSPTDYCILLDSDNQIDETYIDKIYSQTWDKKTILAPDFAKPLFDYTEFSGLTISKENVAKYMDRPFFATCLNCMNYFVSAMDYVKVWDANTDPHSSDSIYQNMNWFKWGNKMHIVPGMQYEHLVHDESHYKLNCSIDPEFYQKVEEELKNMK